MEQQGQAQNHLVLCCQCDNTVYGLEISGEVELLDGLNTVPLPCMPAYVVGMVGVREDAAVVCSARGVLGAEAEPFLEKQPVLLRHGDVAIILMFDVVQDVIECPDDQIHHLQEVAQTGLLRLQRLYMHEGKPMYLISPQAIVSAITADFNL